MHKSYDLDQIGSVRVSNYDFVCYAFDSFIINRKLKQDECIYFIDRLHNIFTDYKSSVSKYPDNDNNKKIIKKYYNYMLSSNNKLRAKNSIVNQVFQSFDFSF